MSTTRAQRYSKLVKNLAAERDAAIADRERILGLLKSVAAWVLVQHGGTVLDLLDGQLTDSDLIDIRRRARDLAS